MTTFACVYRTGGDFGPEHVVALYYNFYAYHDADAIPFVCLTDSSTIREQFRGVDNARVVSLTHDTPGWWAKLELFRHDVFEPGERVLYLDLDMIPTGPLDDLIAYDDPDAVVASGSGRLRNFASGIMTFRAGQHVQTALPLYLDDPAGMRWHYDSRRHGASGGRRGDQGLVVERVEHEGWRWVRAEDIQSGIYRYTLDSRLWRNHDLPGDARLIVFSGGRNRPDKVWPELWLHTFERDDEEAESWTP